jgi:hypothetical protein
MKSLQMTTAEIIIQYYNENGILVSEGKENFNK